MLSLVLSNRGSLDIYYLMFGNEKYKYKREEAIIILFEEREKHMTWNELKPRSLAYRNSIFPNDLRSHTVKCDNCRCWIIKRNEQNHGMPPQELQMFWRVNARCIQHEVRQTVVQ